MFKFLGALLVLGVSAWLGVSGWRRLQVRVHMLSKLCVAMEFLRTEIVFLQTPLPEAVCRAARQTGCAVFEDFAKYLQSKATPQAAMQSALHHNGVLNAQDVELLIQIAGGLGCSTAEMQKVHIGSAVKQLEAQRVQANTYLQNNGRLCIGTGMLGGLLLVILLL